MEITLLGAHNTESESTGMVTLLIDGVLAVDTGSLTSSLSFEEQLELKAVLLSHQHYDHIRNIPTLGMNLFLCESSLDIYGTQPVYDALTAHFLNAEVYANFLELPPENPTIRFTVLEPGQETTVAGYRVLPLPVNHSQPTVGYKITDADGKEIFYTADTGPGLADVWRQISPQLLFIELTGPNRYQDTALTTRHLTPSLLQRELESFREIHGYLPQVVTVHMNPIEEKDITVETAAMAEALEASLRLGYEGMRLEI